MPRPGRSRLALLTLAAAVLAVLLTLLLRGGDGPGRPAGRAGAEPSATSAPAEHAVPTRLPITIPPPPRSPSAPDALPPSFEGRVVSSATGQGVAGAELTFSRAGAAASVRAGPDGAFRFDPP